MSRAVAINVAANTNIPGARGPVFPDGSFVYVPIPEREQTTEAVPTYADLDLAGYVPGGARDLPVHLDPEFAGTHGRSSYTYGDPHGVKAGPLSRLDPGDLLLFYATLSRAERSASARSDPDATPARASETSPARASETSPARASDATDPPRDWLAPEWGAYLVGEFEVAEVLAGEAYRAADGATRGRFDSNAHVRREAFDAAVLVRGTDRSRLYDRAVPLSTPGAGAEANELVTELSTDSGRGPWWRRVLRYDGAATGELRERIETDPAEWLD
ncbi:Nmad3 family putative nucleotide modification protein [Halorarum salinum]|uniref:Nucleotide modification associated domain-containing protein n=1 Tax=Halorarum salinum TaxID=2743089 RepID=A0A7D5QAS1_9EURY|nr:hypothetical protein [Halobaculum salinum]QLG61200.1 hypothetical protein HUG12_05395 [Halobaculum salinum]